MNYAEVAVNSPGSRSTFCYAIPPALNISVGQAVWVPFGSRVIQGIVLHLSKEPAVAETKEVTGIVTDGPLLSPIQVSLAQWISGHYFASPFDALALMLPPGFERRAITSFQLTTPDLTRGQADLSLTPEQRQVLQIVNEKKISLPELERTIGKIKARQITGQLIDCRLIRQTLEFEEPRIKPKTVPYIRLTAGREEVEVAKARLSKARAHRQAELLAFLAGQTRPVSISELKECFHCSPATIKALESRHLVSVERLRVRRDPLFRISLTTSPPPVLTSSQQAAWESIQDGVVKEARQSDKPLIVLLFGVTGSGKTEIYLRALAQVIATGRKGICLIPEIALTQQTVERFAGRFPGRVAVLHSGLSAGEQFDEWQWIREGNCDVVIGPRSALFAPLPNLGLVIIDEEHEWTYKQEDKSPRYHARDAAIKLAQLSDAVVILGSATPDIGSFHRAQQGEYHLAELKERITPRGYSPLPEVTIVDLREELKAGNTSLLSRSLLAAMKETLAQRQQIILFLNRRGAATFVRCRSCGFVLRCPRCSIALTYHSVEKKMICHRCRYSIPVSQDCPRCSRRSLRFLGIGTQRVEEEVRHFFPEARVLRWDRDVITRRYAHEELLKRFRDRKADVLIGTQMIAKGLDLPQVTLAGVISADTGLNFPDFRSGERTFQLLCQVAGRAGRGVKTGKVIIQTYSPDNYIIGAAAKHDYLEFYHKEIDYRRRYNYPPFSQLVRLVYSNINEELCRREAQRVHRLILDEKAREDIIDFDMIGPVPAFAFKARGRYRWQLFLRGSDSAQVLSRLTLPRGWTIDVDPVGMV
ncbi:MAG: primosomal protein N' [Chloroflexi bacterium RBG_13_51_36]|nr:MAG: primosomal protein N' [Chloroflexi bacterium RBG_13_51_36]